MNDAYHVPKHQVRAEIRLPGAPPMDLRLFLSECAETHSGVERPSDLLNSPARFLPAVDADGKMIFLHRDAVLAVSIDSEDELGGDALIALSSAQATSQQVEVVMEDGNRFQGTVSYLMPEGSRRLQDFLNQGDRFLVLQDGDTVRLLNKRRMVQLAAV